MVTGDRVAEKGGNPASAASADPEAKELASVFASSSADPEAKELASALYPLVHGVLLEIQDSALAQVVPADR